MTSEFQRRKLSQCGPSGLGCQRSVFRNRSMQNKRGRGERGDKHDNDTYQLTVKPKTHKDDDSRQCEQTPQHESYRENKKADPDLEQRFTESVRVSEGTNGLFGYHFINEGALCDEAGHRFGQKGAKTVDPDTFSKLTTKIMEFVQENLVNVHGLEKITVPVDADKDEPQSFIFASPNALSTTGKLLILIHGSGTVVAGIWSKKVIMYDNLYKGSQLPYVEEALSTGYEVVVLNTNVNSRLVEVPFRKLNAAIRGSRDPVEHALYVWDNFIFKSKAQHIAIVAHSYGGVVTTELARRRKDNFLRKVFAVAFTDSVHRLDHKGTPREVTKFFCDNARNWVTSDKVLDTPIGNNRKQSLNDAPKVSAGDLRHEWTSHSAFRSVFAFFDQKFKARSSEAQKQGTAVADPKTGTNV